MSDGGSLLNWMREFIGDELFYQAEAQVFQFLNQLHPILKENRPQDMTKLTDTYISSPILLPFWSGGLNYLVKYCEL